MLFQRKVDRAVKWLHDRSDSGKAEQTEKEGNLPSMDDLRAQAQNEMELEKGDWLAMLIAALVTILRVALVVLLVMVSALLVVIFLS